MIERTRDAFLIAATALLIIIAALLVINSDPNNIIKLWDTFGGVITALLFGVVLIGVIHAVAAYKLRRAEIESDTQVALADMGAMAPHNNGVTLYNDRIVPFKSSNGTVRSKGIIQLTDTLSLPKQDVIDFVGESLKDDGIGLAISRWKLDRGWDQGALEQLLDFLGVIGVVTPRENGRACTYTMKFSAEEVLRIVGNNAIYA